MFTLNFKTEKGWKTLYSYLISKFLRTDKDLADVRDKAEARKNLEINGDNNTTHFHDSRYLPLIQRAEDNAVNYSLRVANNLSDLSSLEEAQQNLGITGSQNTTHSHDQRYYPKEEIDAVINDIVNSTLPISSGGTGATNATKACINLGVFDIDGRLVLPNGNKFWIA